MSSMSMSLNNLIIECFEKLIMKTTNDMKTNKEPNLHFKIRSYNKVIDVIKSISFNITNIEHIRNIKGVGKSSIDKIEEIINTGTLEAIKSLASTIIDNSKLLNELQRVTGIGPAKAQTLLSQNITLDKLLTIKFNSIGDDDLILLDSLTHHQTLGIKYFKDLEHKIPHGEIVEIEKYLKDLIAKYIPEVKLIICGSYRRQKETSGDIDILLYHNRLDETPNYLTEFINLLVSNKFITDSLTNVDNSTKYMGFCKYAKFNRRIDIRLIPKKSIGSAMLYFTGSGEFNKSMRTFALTQGFTINEYGIYKLKVDKTKGLKIKTNNEEDIFKVLKIPYVHPKDRIPTYKFTQ